MPTGRIGGSDSRLSNIILGYGASRRKFVSRSAREPLYRVEVCAFHSSGDFSVGTIEAELDRFKALGYSDYLNNVPEAFFTLHQDDPKIASLRGLAGKCHVRIWRENDLVWAGHGGLEWDATSRDAIFYSYGYLANLFWMRTDWAKEWTSETVHAIVSEAWGMAKTSISYSRLGWITTGTIESPKTIAGGSTAINLPSYQAFHKRLLFLMQEMAAISASDTGNSTAFEITPQGVFNFWEDRSRDVGNLRWEYGGKIQDFHEIGLPVYRRNDVVGIGQQPRDVILRKSVIAGNAELAAWGRMQDSLFFPWVKDETELDRVLKVRADRALQTERQLSLDFHVGVETPPNTSTSRWRLGDTAAIKIDRGVTNIDARYQIVGYQVAVLNGKEKINVALQEPL